MDRIKAIYRWEDKTTPVVIIGVTDKGLTCVFPDNGQIAYLPPMNVMVDLTDWNGQSDAGWLAERIDQLIREIQAIQTYGLRLNK